MSLQKQIFLTVFILFVCVIAFGMTDIDIQIQNYFFDKRTHQWIVDRNAQPYKFIFYDGIKKLLILFAVFLLFIGLFFKNNIKLKAYKKGLIIVVLSAILVPLMTGALKKSTNMPCPKNETYYGGVYPKTKVWESYPKSFHQVSKIACYPAGHASGGFALLSLFFLFKRRKTRLMVVAIALTIGWSMGIYKMLIGDHFFSHTLITMLLAWLIILSIVGLVERVDQKRHRFRS